MVCERAGRRKTTNEKRKNGGEEEKMRKARNPWTSAKKSEQRSVDRVRKVENLYRERRRHIVYKKDAA